MGKLKKYFRSLRDPRAANASYPLLEILFVALAAVLCGAKSCTDMSDFGRRKIDLLRRFVPLEKGVPSHDVFSDDGRATVNETCGQNHESRAQLLANTGCDKVIIPHLDPPAGHLRVRG